jgi:hypothetical protein
MGRLPALVAGSWRRPPRQEWQQLRPHSNRPPNLHRGECGCWCRTGHVAGGERRAHQAPGGREGRVLVVRGAYQLGVAARVHGAAADAASAQATDVRVALAHDEAALDDHLQEGQGSGQGSAQPAPRGLRRIASQLEVSALDLISWPGTMSRNSWLAATPKWNGKRLGCPLVSRAAAESVQAAGSGRAAGPAGTLAASACAECCIPLELPTSPGSAMPPSLRIEMLANLLSGGGQTEASS